MPPRQRTATPEARPSGESPDLLPQQVVARVEGGGETVQSAGAVRSSQGAPPSGVRAAAASGRRLAGSVLGAVERRLGGGARRDAGAQDAASLEPASSPARRLARMNPFAKKRAGRADKNDRETEEMTGDKESDTAPDQRPGTGETGGRDYRSPLPSPDERIRSPLHRFTGAFTAALRSLSPPRTAGQDSAAPSDAGPRVQSLPSESPARSPLSSARSLPAHLSGSTQVARAATVLTAANRFKRGGKNTKRATKLDMPMIREGPTEEDEELDLNHAFQQAEDGMLRELAKENRLLWKLDRAGVLEEVNINFKNHLKRSAALFELVDFDYSTGTGSEEEDTDLRMQERYVRCFVSAPYSDMQAERRLLAQEVFPAIRQRCMEIGVIFMECDFCWGVPEQIAERKSNIMERMLEMRQNIKTYIIGLVAERYGYSYLLDATPGHLAQDPLFAGKRAAVLGLQEIELDEGPLARDIPHTAFYYFRDSKYLDEVEDADVRSTLQSEGLLSRERLSHLKAKLRLSGIPIRYNYKSPEEFASLCLSDLSTKIVEDFPAESTKEMLMEVDKHILHEFEESTLKVFEGREDAMTQLDDRVLSVQTKPGPTVVVGGSGVGKSAFLAAWSRRFQKKHGYDFMYKHYAGMNTESGCWAVIVRGIMQGLKDTFNLRAEIPNEIELLPGALSLFFGITSSLERRVIIMIDAVDLVHDIHVDPEPESSPDSDDEVDDDDDHPLDRQPRSKDPHHLGWLPTIVPPNVRLIVSVTEGTHACDLLTKDRCSCVEGGAEGRRWEVFKLHALEDDSRTLLLNRYLKARGLEMPDGVKRKLLERGPSKLPLFLVTILRSCQHPDDMKPSGPLGTYLYARGMKELAKMVIDRLENTDGLQERRGLVEEVLSCVALSRRGLAEPEIVGMMQVPRALFTKFYLQTRTLFQVFFGLMSFTSIEFELEVHRRYLVHDEIKVMIRNRIVSYFTFRPLTLRTVEEVPWQLFQSRKWTELGTMLANPEVFMILTNTKSGVFDLIVYWESLTQDPHLGGGGVSIADKMEECVRRSKAAQFPVHEQIALFISAADLLQRLQFYDIAMTYNRRACDLEERLIGLSGISKIEYMLKETRIFLQKKDFRKTRENYEKTLKALTALVDVDGDGEITYEELKATDAGTLLLDTEEELMFMLYEGQYYSSLEQMCLHMLGREEDRPTNELLLFDVLINTYVETGKLDSAFDFISSALKAIPNPQCDEYLHVLGRRLGLCLMRGNYLQAIETVEDSGWIWEAINSGDEENLDDLIDILCFYSCALAQSGRAEDAVRMLNVAIDKQYPPEDENSDDSSSSSADSGSEMSSVSDIKKSTRADRQNVVISDVMMLDLIGMARREVYELEAAESSHKKALSFKVLSVGATSASNAYTMSELAAMYEQKRNKNAALKMRKVACAIIRETMGDRNTRYYMALQAQAATHWKFGDFQEARHFTNIVIGGIERAFGSRSELLPGALLLMGLTLCSLGELREAENVLIRSHDLSTVIWGERCVAASNATFALALVEERKGEFEQAELKFRQTMQAREDQIGPLHSYLQQDMSATSLLYYRIEAHQEVEDLLRTSLPAMQAVHGPNSLCVAGILTLLALVHAKVGKTKINDVETDPAALIQRALRIRRKIFGSSAAVNQHEMLTALVLSHLGAHDNAEPLFRKSYIRATTSRKTPHRLRWLLFRHMVRSSSLAYDPDDIPKQPEWTDDYADLMVDLGDLFDRLDSNKNGLLSRNELKAGLIAEGYDPEDVLDRMPLLFNAMDKDGDGEITKDEFIIYFDSHDKLLSPIYKEGVLDNAANMGRLFERLDVDKNGLLSRAELREGLLQEGYQEEDLVNRLPRLFSSMDKDGDGEITKEEFISHFEVNKGFSPIAGSESSPTKSAVLSSPVRSPFSGRKVERGEKSAASRSQALANARPSTTATKKDIVDSIIDDIQEVTTAREIAEAAHEAEEVAQNEALQAHRENAGQRPSSARSSSWSRTSSQGSRGSRGAAKEQASESAATAGPGGSTEPSAHGPSYDRLMLHDDGREGDLSRPRTAFASDPASNRARPASASLSSSRTNKSSIGTEQAREELDVLEHSVTEMVEGVFADVVDGFSSPAQSIPRSQLPLILDYEEFEPHKGSRPLSAPGGRRRRPARSEEELVRPETAGPRRPQSAMQSAPSLQRRYPEPDDLDASLSPGSTLIPRLSMTAAGRARQRRRLDAIDARDEHGNTSLHWAVRDNDVDAVKSLLEAGANVNTLNLRGEAPIHVAARAGALRIVKLVAAAAPGDINQPGPEGFTALHLAVESGSLALVQTLCETFGADISYQANNGETAKQLALRILEADSPIARYLSAAMDLLPSI